MKSHQQRRAFSLIEMLVFISVGSVLFLLAIALVHLSMNISRAADRQWEQDAVLARLVRQFRRDVHQATALELLAESQLRLDFGSEREVVWSLHQQPVRRNSQQNQPAGMEDYPLGNRYEVKLVHEPSENMIRLLVRRRAEFEGPELPVERIVQCQVGSKLKLAASQQAVTVNPNEPVEAAR